MTTRRRIKAKVERKRGAFLAAFLAAEEPIAEAGTRAIEEAANEAKAGARATIASAGFGRKWQNALRADVYPKGGQTSVNAAAHIYHKIPYSGVFEEGARISGSPYLWLPLPHVPGKLGRFRMTPARYPEPLQFVRRAGKPPLLVARIGMSRAAARRGGPARLSAATIRRGAQAGGARRVVRAVPVFVGISTVRIRKRFNVGRAVRQAANRLPALYLKHFQDE